MIGWKPYNQHILWRHHPRATKGGAIRWVVCWVHEDVTQANRPGACAPGFVHGKKKGFALRPFLRRKPAPLAGTLRWARFLPDEKSGKESPKAGPSPALFPPPCGIHPAVRGVPAFSLFRPIAWWGHIDSSPFYGLDLLLCSCVLLPPGPYPGEPLFPANGGLASGGGNAAHRGEALETGAPSHREGNAFHRLARPSM